MELKDVYSKLTAIKYLRELPNTVAPMKVADLDGIESERRYLGLKDSKDIVEKIMELAPKQEVTPIPTFDAYAAKGKAYEALDKLSEVINMPCNTLSVIQAANIMREFRKANKAIQTLIKAINSTTDHNIF